MEDLPSGGVGQHVVARLDSDSKATAGGEVELGRRRERDQALRPRRRPQPDLHRRRPTARRGRPPAKRRGLSSTVTSTRETPSRPHRPGVSSYSGRGRAGRRRSAGPSRSGTARTSRPRPSPSSARAGPSPPGDCAPGPRADPPRGSSAHLGQPDAALGHEQGGTLTLRIAVQRPCSSRPHALACVRRRAPLEVGVVVVRPRLGRPGRVAARVQRVQQRRGEDVERRHGARDDLAVGRGGRQQQRRVALRRGDVAGARHHSAVASWRRAGRRRRRGSRPVRGRAGARAGSWAR